MRAVFHVDGVMGGINLQVNRVENMAAICEYKYATITGSSGMGGCSIGNGVIVAIKLLRIRLGYGRVGNRLESHGIAGYVREARRSIN